MPVFFIPANSVQDEHCTLHDPLVDHLFKSLRFRVGDQVWFNDEQRRRYRCRILRIGPQYLEGEILEILTAPQPSFPRLILGQAILKGDHMNWLIQKATELGVSRIVPLLSHRTVVRPPHSRWESCQARWQRIAREAAQQAERWEIPEVAAPCSLKQFWQTYAPAQTKCLLVARTTTPYTLSTLPLPHEAEACIVFAVGPEGGWTETECQESEDQLVHWVTLGASILRAETAALAALSILQSRLGRLG
ncbi:MAG: 16S rRNA (uracil(1498)-N(3))-methyltransferase [Nitrospirae bacterium]|nr:MAG: 16S rRNA (uracil(1498)-N(3))-methyltransferase [Nitrospirota bacterium]